MKHGRVEQHKHFRQSNHINILNTGRWNGSFMKEYLIGDKSRGQRFQLFLELLRRVTDRSLQSQSSCRPPCITFIRPAQAFLGGILHLLRYMMRYCTRWNDCLPQRLVGAFCHVSSPALTKRLNLPLSYGGCGTVVLHLVSCILHLASCHALSHSPLPLLLQNQRPKPERFSRRRRGWNVGSYPHIPC